MLRTSSWACTFCPGSYGNQGWRTFSYYKISAVQINWTTLRSKNPRFCWNPNFVETNQQQLCQQNNQVLRRSPNSLCRVLGSIRWMVLVTLMHTQIWFMLPRLWASLGDRHTTLSCKPKHRTDIPISWIFNQNFWNEMLNFGIFMFLAPVTSAFPMWIPQCDLQIPTLPTSHKMKNQREATLHMGTISTEKVLL